MKKTSPKLKATLPGIVLALAMPLSANASTLQEVVESINSFKEQLIEWAGELSDLYVEHLYGTNPSYPYTVAANITVPSIDADVVQKMSEVSSPIIQELLVPPNMARTLLKFARAPASDTVEKATSTRRPFSVTGSREKANYEAGDDLFNSDTLLNTLAYQSDQVAEGQEQDPSIPTRKAAFAYLQYATNLSQPFGIELNNEQRQKLEGTFAGNNYKVALRSMIAARSLALNNLIGMYAKRLPIEGSGKEAGMPDQINASAAEVQHYIATRRATDKGWYASMSAATPATIARETLFVLVEIQREIYELRQDNERILATLSIMDLNNQASQQEALEAKEQEVKRLLGIN